VKTRNTQPALVGFYPFSLAIDRQAAWVAGTPALERHSFFSCDIEYIVKPQIIFLHAPSLIFLKLIWHGGWIHL